jgi:hypothetical protein
MFDSAKGDALHIELTRLGLVTLLHIRTMEAGMHGSFDKPGETIRNAYRSWGIAIFALPALVVIALIGLAMTNPDTSNWISNAVQAEFMSTNYGPETAPTQIAKPASAIRTVRAN